MTDSGVPGDRLLKASTPSQHPAETMSMAQVDPAAATSAGPVAGVIPGYEVLRELSRGGQGVVYQAIQKSTQRKVAVKVLLEGPYASPHARRRFEREVELVSHLKHPNIIAVFDSGTTSDGRLYYVMDYVRGLPVTEYVRQQKLGLEQAMELFATICDAVNHAHQKGVIHRNLKPSNILVDGDGSVRILDFGLAKAVTERHESLATVTGQVMGTLPYMSPEQTRGNPDLIDTRTDVYALGVILYEILTGAYPYPVVGEIAEVLRHIAQTDPQPPTRSWTKDMGVAQSVRGRRRCPIDDEVATIALKSLSKERERRYQSAGELAADVRHYLANEPIEAKRDSGLYVLRKMLRRYRVPAAVAAAFALLLATAAVVLSIALHQTDQAKRNVIRERDQAEAQRDRADGEKQRADMKASEAEQQKRIAQSHLVESLMAQGDAYSGSREWDAARKAYGEASSLLQATRGKAIWADSALAIALQSSPPPLLRFGAGGKPFTAIGPINASHRFYAFTRDGVCSQWDALTGARLRQFGTKTEGTSCATFAGNGKSAIVFDSASHKAVVWDLPAGAVARSFDIDGLIVSASISANGSLIAGGDMLGNLTQWDMASGQKKQSQKAGVGWLWATAFSPKAQYIATGGDDRLVKVWNVTAPTTRPVVCEGHSWYVTSTAWSSDGKQIVSGSADKTVRVWDAHSGKEVHRFAHRGIVRSVRFAMADQYVISTGDDRRAMVWDIGSGEGVALVGHEAAVSTCSLGATGKLVTGSDNGKLILWGLSDGPAVQLCQGHRGSVSAVAVSADGRMGASAGADRTIRLWDVATGQNLGVISKHPDEVKSLAFAPDGAALLAGGADGPARLWDLLGRKEFARFRGHDALIFARADGADGRLGEIDLGGPKIEMTEIAQEKKYAGVRRHASLINDVKFSADGIQVLTASGDATVRLWNARTGEQTGKFAVEKGPALAADFAAGRQIVAADGKGNLFFWDAGSAALVERIAAHGEGAGALAVSRDRAFALTAGRDGRLRRWDLAQRRAEADWPAFGTVVHSIALLADGTLAVSRCEDEKIRLWDTETGRELRQVPFAATALAVAGDGRTLVAGAADGTVIIWRFREPAAYAFAGQSAGVPATSPTTAPGQTEPQLLKSLGEWYASQNQWALAFAALTRKTSGSRRDEPDARSKRVGAGQSRLGLHGAVNAPGHATGDGTGKAARSLSPDVFRGHQPGTTPRAGRR